MILDMVLLAWMATGYKYVDYTTGEGVTRDVDSNDNVKVTEESQKDEKSDE